MVDLHAVRTSITLLAQDLVAQNLATRELDLVNAAGDAAHGLPMELIRPLRDFYRDGHPSGALLLRGLPTGVVGPTPAQAAEGEAPEIARAVQALVGAVLGEQVGYAEEASGGLFQNICPNVALETQQSSGSSAVVLDQHTETAFHQALPAYVALFCLRQDHESVAGTTLVSVDRLLPALDESTKYTLMHPEFVTHVDLSFGGGVSATPVEVLHGHPVHPFLRYDADLMEGTTERARRALDAVRPVAQALQSPVRLRAGELLVIDNFRAIHGRTPFRARYDGADRWLLRSFLVRDLAASAALRSPGDRIIHMRPTMPVLG